MNVLTFCLGLEQDALGRLALPPLLRSATRAGTHARAAERARTAREFAAQAALVIRDLDDAEFWLEALVRLKFGPGTVAHQLQIEASELRRILGVGERAPSGNRGTLEPPVEWRHASRG